MTSHPTAPDTTPSPGLATAALIAGAANGAAVRDRRWAHRCNWPLPWRLEGEDLAHAVELAGVTDDRWVASRLPLHRAEVWSAAAARRPRPRWLANLLISAFDLNGLSDLHFAESEDLRAPGRDAERGRRIVQMVLDARLGPKVSRPLFVRAGREAYSFSGGLAQVASRTDPARTASYVLGLSAQSWRTGPQAAAALREQVEVAVTSGAPAWVSALVSTCHGLRQLPSHALGGVRVTSVVDLMGPLATAPAAWMLVGELAPRYWSTPHELVEVVAAALAPNLPDQQPHAR